MLLFLKGIFKNHYPPHTGIGVLVSRLLTDSIFFRDAFKPHCSPCIGHLTQAFPPPRNCALIQILELGKSSNFSISTYNCYLVLAKLNSKILEN